MNLRETLWQYGGSIWGYTVQMLPCMFAALVLFLMLWPARQRRIVEKGLVSRPCREIVLLLFVMFGAGLASLTLFPAHFWNQVIQYLRFSEIRDQGLDLTALYPSWEQTMAGIADLPDVLTPFQEIRRAFRVGSWLMFMMVGNIAMFIPVGFFPALLWRKARWWKSLLLGAAASCTIEFVQFFIGRSTDIDDVILNTAGALAGYWLFWLTRAIFPRLISRFQCNER